MELPAIKIPEIPLPFDIPVLLHPPVDHFIIALPIVVLLLEIINLFAKKRAIGVVSFFLIILTAVAAVAAYFTGTVDGKEAWDILSQAGQNELKAHKIFGTYLMLASGVLLLFKLLSAIIQRGMMKGLFLLILVLFAVGILKQGKDGGELVYKYGANVKIVKTMDDEIFELKDELSDYIAKKKEVKKAAVTVVETPKEAVVTESAKEKVTTEVKEETKPETAEKKVEEKVETVTEPVEKKLDEAKENVTPAVETATETVENKTEEAKEAVSETVAKVETSVEEVTAPTVEVVPVTEAPKPEISTH